ncbi:MAG: kelch motif-containing protein [Ignavibacteriales bacterium]|nr:kelch motif-containing protein [Ignavibacteriales bacterium]
MPTDRGLLACATIDNKIYVMGGIRSLGGGYDWGGIKTMEVYDVITETWSQLPDMPTKDGAIQQLRLMVKYMLLVALHFSLLLSIRL